MEINDLGIIDHQALVDDFDLIAGNGDNPLDVVDIPVLGKTKDDDIATDRGLPWHQEFAGKRHPQAIDEFIDQEMVADLQGRQHRPGGNLECLHDKGTDKESQQHGDDDRLDILSDDRFASCFTAQFQPLMR